MLEFRDASRFSLSLSEIRDSTETSIAMEVEGEDEEFYEKMEAPKFVDFTVPNHHCPDDRYWFCLRVGCDQQHEKEMDSETIYKNFLLRVMAARSPNVRLQKALDRNASSSKCPQSAPPKSSKSRLAVISSITQKIKEDKKKVVRPLLKPVSTTPATTKTKPAAAKCLTTPRKRNSPKNQNSFRSVRNPKSMAIEVPKNRTVAKALVFHSPKKAIKVKTSVELKTPLTRLRERGKRVEITSQRKIGCSNKSLKNTTQNREAKSVASTKSKEKVQLSKHSKKELEENGSNNLDIDAKPISSSSETNNIRNNLNLMVELNDNDDKENVAVSTENRAHDHNLKLKGKILGLQDSCGKVNKGAQTKDKSSGMVAPPTMKFHKPKPTTPKPFRLRTDERGILKEANLERKNNVLAPQNDQRNENNSQLQNKCKADMHQGSENDAEKIQRSDSKKEKSKTKAAITPKRLHSKHQELKPRTSKLESKAMKRLENFRKLTSSQQHQQIQHQGLTSTRRKMISFTNPSRPLEVIYETSESRKAGN